MSRRWFTTLLFALAVAVQAFAPMANGVANAHQRADAAASIENCLKAAAANGGAHHGPGHVHRHCDSCALCQAFVDGVAPVAARPVSLGMAPVLWTRFRWTVADRALPSSPRDYARQARAPPAFS